MISNFSTRQDAAKKLKASGILIGTQKNLLIISRATIEEKTKN
jgi:hypothetical protein